MKTKAVAVPSYGRRGPSRYYGDMSPRTMHEAFGPYTRPLSVEDRRAVRLRFVLALVLAALVALAVS